MQSEWNDPDADGTDPAIDRGTLICYEDTMGRFAGRILIVCLYDAAVCRHLFGVHCRADGRTLRKCFFCTDRSTGDPELQQYSPAVRISVNPSVGTSKGSPEGTLLRGMFLLHDNRKKRIDKRDGLWHYIVEKFSECKLKV